MNSKEESPALYESTDHGPVTREDINKAYSIVAGLVEGLKHIGNGLIADAADDQYGRIQVIVCCLDAIEDEIYRISPKMWTSNGDKS